MLLISQNAVVSAKMILNAKTLVLEKKALNILINVIRKREATLVAEVNSYFLPLIYRHVYADIGILVTDIHAMCLNHFLE